MTAHPEMDDVVQDAVLRKFRLDIGKLDNDSPALAIAEIIGRIIDSGINNIDTERLLKVISKQTDTPIGVIRK
jgi:hypothetical protein